MKARIEILQKLRSETETLLKNATEFKERFANDPINWGDLGCTEVLYCLDDEGEERYQIRISECASSASKLQRYIIESLESRYKDDTIEVITEW